MKRRINKVLLIDDDTTMNYVNEFLIKHYNVCEEVIVEPYPEEALLFLSKNANNIEEIPEIILLDINMPVLNGYQFLNALEKLSEIIKSKINVYILSSSDSNSDRAKTSVYSFVKGYLVKPLNSEDIKKVFENFT